MSTGVVIGWIVGFIILTAFIQKVAERVLKIKISNGRALLITPYSPATQYPLTR